MSSTTNWPFRYFSPDELKCKCGCGGLPEESFVARLDLLRGLYGRPLVVTSGYRCPAYNARVSSTGTTGPHTTGRAVDFAVMGEQAYELVGLAYQMGFTGIGLQQKGTGRFVHLDDLRAPEYPRPTIWTY